MNEDEEGYADSYNHVIDGISNGSVIPLDPDYYGGVTEEQKEKLKLSNRFVKLKGELILPEKGYFEKTNIGENIQIPWDINKILSSLVEKQKILEEQMAEMEQLVNALVYQPGSDLAKQLSFEWDKRKQAK